MSRQPAVPTTNQSYNPGDPCADSTPFRNDKRTIMMANTSTSATTTKPFSPRMANLLQSPSQQELEAARQLVEHSQAHVPATQEMQQSHTLPTQHQHEHSGSFAHGYRDANDYAQSVQSSLAVPLASAPIMQPSRTSPSAMNSMTTPGGQMCRYVSISAVPEFVI